MLLTLFYFACPSLCPLQPTPLSEPERQLLVPYSTKANAFCGLHGSFFPIFFLPNSQKAFAFVEYGTRSCLSGSDIGVATVKKDTVLLARLSQHKRVLAFWYQAFLRDKLEVS